LNKRSEGGGSVKIDLRQNKQVYLKFPDSDTCLIEWLSSSLDESSDSKDRWSRDSEATNLQSTELKKMHNQGEQVRTKEDNKQFKGKRKEALITHLAELEPHEISAICVALLKDSEYRNFPKPQPERSHALTSYFERFNRTDELVEHIRKRKPELYKMIEQDMEE